MIDRSTGRFALFRQAIADGIPCMFGNPGSSEENLLDALSDPEFAGFTYYLALQEASAVAIADAYARAAPPSLRPGDLAPWRRPALVQLHSYAGLANGLGMMFMARRGYTPMVVIAGEAGLRYDAMDGQMAADLVDITRPFVKCDHNGPCTWRVTDPGSVLRLFRRAVKTAATPPFGPVFLALPMDVLDAPNTEPVVRTMPVLAAIPAERNAIIEAARHLAAARRPIILIGDEIAASGAQAELAHVATLVGATVWGGNDSEVNVPPGFPLYGGALGHMFGDGNRATIAAADVVLACGTTLFPEVFPALDGVFAPGAKLLQFGLNAAELGKTWPVAVAGLGDLKPTLAALGDAIAAGLSAAQVEETRSRASLAGREVSERRRQAVAADEAKAGRGGVHLASFAKALAARLPKDAMIFDEALTSSPELMRYLPHAEPGSYFQTRAGMLGSGLPGTIGLKIAHPQRTVVGFCGDGGGIATIQALATAARHRIGAKFVVCNNRSYRILKDNLRDYRQVKGLPDSNSFPESFDLKAPALRFDLLAEAQGVRALRVDDNDAIADALHAAFADDAPFLIELMIDPER